MGIYFTSDLHFGHDKEFLWGARGFSSSQEHDEVVIERINSIVKPDDHLFILGDLMLGNYIEDGIRKVKQLNGIKTIIVGNHDSERRLQYYRQEHIGQIEMAMRYHIGKHSFILSHYPTMTANIDDDKKPWQRVYNLCGHTHTINPFWHWEFGCYHVELDAHNCYPVPIEKIIEDMRSVMTHE